MGSPSLECLLGPNELVVQMFVVRNKFYCDGLDALVYNTAQSVANRLSSFQALGVANEDIAKAELSLVSVFISTQFQRIAMPGGFVCTHWRIIGNNVEIFVENIRNVDSVNIHVPLVSTVN